MILHRYCLLLILILSGAVASWAQTTDDIPLQQNPIGSSQIIDTTEGILPLDSAVPMSYVLLEDPDQLYFLVDTLTWMDNRHHPLPFYYSHLGNYGTAARPLVLSSNLDHRFSTGWHQFDPYYLNSKNFKYYSQYVPVMKARYSQSGQEKTYLSLDFGRSFARGINLTIIYNRINQVGEFGPAPPDQAQQRNTALGLGIWHDAPSGKYDAFYNYTANSSIGDENGGISAPELFAFDSIPHPFIPVFLTNGLTTHQRRSFLTKQIIHLLADSNSIQMDLWAQATYTAGLFKYIDDNPVNVSFYKSFHTDDRGIRQFTFEENTNAEMGIALPWRAAGSEIQSSLEYRFTSLEQEPINFHINELFWNAQAKFQWVKPFILKGGLSLGLADAGGSFKFSAESILNTGVAGHLSAHYTLIQRKPFAVESRLFVNQVPIYDHAFNDVTQNEFGVQWQWEEQDLLAGFNWIIFDNYIYFDSFPRPVQLGESFSSRQIFLKKSFDFGWFGIHGHLIWQPDSREELMIPDLLGFGGLYGKFRLFKQKLTVMPGMDLIYHKGFSGVGYFPVTGQYYKTFAESIPDYVRVDAGVNLHIHFLKAFLRIEDLQGLWDQRVLYQADFYPHYPGYLRLGVEASFFN